MEQLLRNMNLFSFGAWSYEENCWLLVAGLETQHA
jgi:hypothetical protein